MNTAKHLLSVFDLSEKEIWELLDFAKKLKAKSAHKPYLKGKSLGMIFEKPSTRTSVSFSVAMYQLGGFPLILDVRNMQSNRGETPQDTSRVLSGYLDGVMFRALHHEDVEAFAEASSVPVINGLTNKEHPCQILGDILTIVEKRKIMSPQLLKTIKVAFVGDGNNVANSWVAAAAVLGFKLSLARPEGYGPDKTILARARSIAARTGAALDVTDNIGQAVKDADVIYTDVWTSMGEETEKEQRLIAFKPYQVNDALLRRAKPDCLVMHCLPAVRGEEITSEVMDGPHSVIFQEAENRLHIQKAVLVHLLK